MTAAEEYQSEKDAEKARLKKWSAAAAVVPGAQAPAALFYAGGSLILDLPYWEPGHGEGVATRDGVPVIAPLYPDLATFEAAELSPYQRADLAVDDLGGSVEEIEQTIAGLLLSANPVQWAKADAQRAAEETLYEMIRRTGQIPIYPILKTTMAAAMGDGGMDWLDYVVAQSKKKTDFGPILYAHLQKIAPHVGALGPVSVRYVKQQIAPQDQKRFDRWEDDGSGLSQRSDSSSPSSPSNSSGLVLLGLATLAAGGASAAVVAWRLKHGKKPIPSSFRHPLR